MTTSDWMIDIMLLLGIGTGIGGFGEGIQTGQQPTSLLYILIGCFFGTAFLVIFLTLAYRSYEEKLRRIVKEEVQKGK